MSEIILPSLKYSGKSSPIKFLKNRVFAIDSGPPYGFMISTSRRGASHHSSTSNKIFGSRLRETTRHVTNNQAKRKLKFLMLPMMTISRAPLILRLMRPVRRVEPPFEIANIATKSQARARAKLTHQHTEARHSHDETRRCCECRRGPAARRYRGANCSCREYSSGTSPRNHLRDTRPPRQKTQSLHTHGNSKHLQSMPPN